MRLPLATLRRHTTTVQLEHAVMRAPERAAKPEPPLTPVKFRAPADAVLYLRFWRSDAGAMAVLRNALSRYRQAPASRLSDDDVIDALAAHLARGELVVAGEGPRLKPSGGRDAKPITGTRSAADAAAPEPVRTASLPPVLPYLEKVQIEGAMVLPEVLQTLAQLKLTMGKLKLATVSLEPAPSGVPAISSNLSSASSSITATLDGL